MRIALLGRSQWLYDSAIRLIEAGHDLCAVVTAKASPEFTRTERDFEELAKRAGVPFFLTNRLEQPEILDSFSDADCGVSINWVSVIRQPVLDRFRIGVLNTHMGDLPRYRGNAVANWALLNGESEIVNTVHLMESDLLDCGRIIAQKTYTVEDDTTIGDIYAWMGDTVPDLMVKVIRDLEKNPDHQIKYADPHDEKSFRCYPRLPCDGYIDWSQPPQEIHNLIRSLSAPFPGAYTYHQSDDKIRKLIVEGSRVVSTMTGDLAVPGHVLWNDSKRGESHVRCGAGVLAITKCRYVGQTDSFQPGQKWKSIRMRLGMRAEDMYWHYMGSEKPGSSGL